MRTVFGRWFTLCIISSNALIAYERIEDQNTLSILTPSLKDRKTAKLRLDNGLEVLLISDPDANQSAAALSVETGSFHDPDAYPGMAHFCEHMLFMGSAAYPDETVFWQSVLDNYGTTNAYTKPDRTVYMFSINHGAYNATLDIFAHFFIDPLFKVDAVKRELNAVDQENRKNIENDSWREYMVLKETANQSHPISKFSTGTAETLSIIPIEMLRSWYEEHYTASKMHLVLYSNQPIEALIAATESFSSIANRPSTPLTLDTVLSATQKGHLLYIEPIKNLRRLSLTWELPPAAVLDEEGRLGDLIAYSLSSQGENSLFQLLQKEGFADHLHAEVNRLSKTCALLSLEIDLTKTGVAHIDDVCAHTFQTLAYLKQSSVPPHLFYEFKKMADIEYQWQSRENPFHYVSEAADALVDESLATYPLRHTSIHAYKPKALQDVLDTMTPQNTLFTVIAPAELTKQTYTRKEKWYGVSYTVRPVEEQNLLAWAKIASNSKLGSSIPNRFIPGSIHLISSEKRDLTDTPTLLEDSPVGKCYFVKDSYYLVPNASLQIGIRSPLITAQPKQIVLTDLFIAHLKRRLTSTLSSAHRAGLSANFSQEDLKIVLTIDGFSDKASLLTQTMFDALKGPLPSKEEFALLKEELLTAYENRMRVLPFYQASYALSHVLYNNAPLPSEQIEALQPITFEEFSRFQDDLFLQAYLEGVIAGNLTEQQAELLWNQVQTNFAMSRYPLAEQKRKKVLSLPTTGGPYVLENKTSLQGNAAVIVLQSSDTGFSNTVSQRILTKATSEAFFNTLRTKQQVAYIAQGFAREEQNELLLFFAIHSATHPPEELLARSELFLEEFVQKFDTYLPESRFLTIKQSLITALEKSPDNLHDYMNELSLLAFKWNGNFSRKQALLTAAQALSYEEFKARSLAILSRTNTKRVASLVQGTQTPITYQKTTPQWLRSHQL